MQHDENNLSPHDSAQPSLNPNEADLATPATPDDHASLSGSNTTPPPNEQCAPSSSHTGDEQRSRKPTVLQLMLGLSTLGLLLSWIWQHWLT